MTDGEPEDESRRSIDEDWLAVVVGLALLGLILVGFITNAWVP